MIIDRTDEQIENDVLHFRRNYGISDASPLDPMTVITKIKARRSDFDYLRVSVEEMGATEAEWDSDKNLMRVRNDVLGAMNAGEPRAIFIFAHELAHYLYRHDGVRRRSASREVYEQASPKVRKQERLAERFAARLLAPMYLLSQDTSIAELERRFGLSRRAAEIRKEEIERHYRTETGKQRPLPDFFARFLDELKTGKPPQGGAPGES